jgi:F-type H+-transporting ATPase subunit delta
MADNHTIARPYAQAAFEIASDSNGLDKWSEALAVANDLLSDGQVTTFLANPKLTDEERLSFLTELFASAGGKTSILAGGNKHGTNFLKLLLEYERVSALPEISDHFDRLKANVENTVEVKVTSAAPLSAAQQEAVTKALKERLGREVSLTTAIDENLIGGAVISAGDVVIDGSLRSRLERLSNALIS